MQVYNHLQNEPPSRNRTLLYLGILFIVLALFLAFKAFGVVLAVSPFVVQRRKKEIRHHKNKALRDITALRNEFKGIPTNSTEDLLLQLLGDLAAITNLERFQEAIDIAYEIAEILRDNNFKTQSSIMDIISSLKNAETIKEDLS